MIISLRLTVLSLNWSRCNALIEKINYPSILKYILNALDLKGKVVRAFIITNHTD